MSVWTESVKRGWANLVGPEATRANTTIALTSAVLGTVGAAMWARRSGAGGGSATVMAAMAADLIGGAYVNNTRASVRWYERVGQGEGEHLTFAALHGHPALVAWADHRIGERDNAAIWALSQYGYMMLSTAVIRRSPTHRRSLGLALTAGGLVLDRALGSSTVAPWFAWSYYPKLLMGHAAGSLRPDADIGVAEPRSEV
ncbi:MAG: hypothetical protein ACRDPS_13830 [Nocardioides sp.]|uniref:hypothetical protein n=1 Tax=Nocardioides sp. TaxID=35761 RepID=UPI003D6BA97C